MSANPYDPVTTTDSTHLADDDWGLNLPNIRYGSYGPSRFKNFCSFLRDRARILIVIGCILVLGIVLISIIAVATHSSSGRQPTDTDRERRWTSPEMGLVFYPKPEDGSTVISFSAADKTIDNPIMKSLEDATDPYQLQLQFKSSYMDCTAVSNPPNKTCRYGNVHFGDVCTKHKFWGYHSAMPCIFLQLNLPDNVAIRPINEESLLWTVAQEVMTNHNDTDYVPVHCAGLEKKDRLLLGLHGFDKQDTHPIQYFPPDGLVSYFYRPRNASMPFLKPAMMIHITSLKDDTLVHIKCTAWGQLFDYKDKQIDHKLLTTTFAVYLKH